jgi:hypothetical protein
MTAAAPLALFVAGSLLILIFIGLGVLDRLKQIAHLTIELVMIERERDRTARAKAAADRLRTYD